MTSYEFEKAAKNAVIKVLNENINYCPFCGEKLGGA
jgi:hypothetical protein